MEYNDTRDGIIDAINDRMYVMDDFGNLIEVNFCLFDGWFSEEA